MELACNGFWVLPGMHAKLFSYPKDIFSCVFHRHSIIILKNEKIILQYL